MEDTLSWAPRNVEINQFKKYNIFFFSDIILSKQTEHQRFCTQKKKKDQIVGEREVKLTEK
jgi:hypothetical protein